MISASTEFIRAMQDNHTFKVKIDCTLTDGTQLTIDNSNIRMDSLSFEKAISDDASFDIGSFIVGKLSFTLNNIPGTYNGMDFDGAVLTLYFANQLNGRLYPASNLYPGTNLYPGQIASQYVRIGTYTVVDTDGQNGAWISLVAHDNAYKFQVPLSSINMTFPMTASSFITTVCYAIGVTCASRPASLNSITIQALPDGVEPNCLQALAWCAMMAGRNASIDAYGRLYFPSYPKATLASVQADIEANGWDNADLSSANEISGLINVHTMVDDVTITGVAVTYTNTDGEEATTAISGSVGYVLNLSENAFVDENNVSAVVTNLNDAVVGMTFRPFEIAMMGNPLFEPGDVVWFENRKGQKFLSVLTSMSFTLGEHMTALCGAEAPKKQSAMDYSANTRVIQQTKAIARRAVKIAGDTNQYFWHTESGTDTGAHITEIPRDEFLADPDNGGGNLLARSNGIALRNGLTELSTFGEDGIHLGGAYNSSIDANNGGLSGKSGDGTEVFKIMCGQTDRQSNIVIGTGVIANTNSDKSTFPSYEYKPNITAVDNTTIGIEVIVTHRETNNGNVQSSVLQTTRNYDTSTIGMEQAGLVSHPYTNASITVTASWHTNLVDLTITATASDLEILSAQVSLTVTVPDPVLPSYTFGTRKANTTYAPFSFAEGEDVTASGTASHAEGEMTKATGIASHAEGFLTEASSDRISPDGAVVMGDGSHAEGNHSRATSVASHAEGFYTTASGSASHAEGRRSEATGIASHAEGGATKASGDYSHAGGWNTIASSNNQTVIGSSNIEDTDGEYAFIIGNGSSSSARSNAFAVTWNGDIVLGRSPITTVNGSSVSLANNTATTIAEVTLSKGSYLLTGACRFSTNSSGYRTLLFSASGNSSSAFDRFAVERVGASQDNNTYLQLTWPVEITADGTTIYLNATQTSGSTLTADSNGIKVVRIG